jgi:hypothetical protein
MAMVVTGEVVVVVVIVIMVVMGKIMKYLQIHIGFLLGKIKITPSIMP